MEEYSEKKRHGGKKENDEYEEYSGRRIPLMSRWVEVNEGTNDSTSQPANQPTTK